MVLADNYTDSLLIYCDWLEDNEQLALAIEIRQKSQEQNINNWTFEFPESNRFYVGGREVDRCEPVGFDLGVGSNTGDIRYNEGGCNGDNVGVLTY